MEIYQTLNPIHSICDLKKKLKSLKSIGVTGIRINFNKFNLQMDMKKVLEVIEIMNRYRGWYQYQLDIPYPNSKARILNHNIKNSVIQKDKIYEIYFDKKYYKHLEDSILVSDVAKYTETEILYFGDGQGTFKIVTCDNTKYRVKALSTFDIYKAKSISLGIKDNRENIEQLLGAIENYCVECDFIYVLSLVENVEDIMKFRKKINLSHSIMAKLETHESIRNYKEIISVVDSIMIARGDMAILNDYTKLLFYIEQIVEFAKKANKKVFVATDILTSVRRGDYLPSRADIVDLSHMFRIGCEGVVLSRTDNLTSIERQVEVVREIYESIKICIK